jgi:catechol 2,3-dioxygenase-like lactoylglutathione lyase family enzyme
MALKWYSVVVDCRDVAAQARWWADVLDWQIVFEQEDEAAIVPRHAEDKHLSEADWPLVGPGLVFVPVPETKTVKNRLHIDLAPHLTDDRDALIDALLAKGATTTDIGQARADGTTWTVLADPEGNEFCVLSSRDM